MPLYATNMNKNEITFGAMKRLFSRTLCVFSKVMKIAAPVANINIAINFLMVPVKCHF